MKHTLTGRTDHASDGGYSVLEAAIVLPVAFGLIMLIAQWAVVWHARGVAAAAAEEGVRATAAYQATADQGRLQTESYLAQVAPRSLPDPLVSVTRTARFARVTVAATVASVIPFVRVHVSESASGPVEAYVSAP